MNDFQENNKQQGSNIKKNPTKANDRNSEYHTQETNLNQILYKKSQCKHYEIHSQRKMMNHHETFPCL